MRRRTRSVKTALERLEARWPKTGPDLEKTRLRDLAFRLDLLQYMKVERAEVQEVLGWHGHVPSRGLSAWEESALKWGKLDEEDVQ